MAYDKSSTNDRLLSLDGWRAIAILLVIASHFHFTNGFPARFVPGMDAMGNLGVRIFFVISGLLITRLLLQEHERFGRLDLKAFYVRRALRIFPLAFTFILVLAALQLAGLYHDTAGSWLGAATFTRNIFGQGKSASSHFWSLGIEEQFYLLWPCAIAAAALFVRRRRAGAVLAACVAAALACRLYAAHMGPQFETHRLLGMRSFLRYVDSLAIGCAAAMWGRSLKAPSGITALAAAAVLVGSHVAEWFGGPALLAALLPTVQAVAVAVLLLHTVSARSGPAFAVLNFAPIVRVGVLSYSLYVWHFLFLANFAGERLGQLWMYDWKWWLPCAFLVALLSHELIEKPFLRLKQHFVPHAQPIRQFVPSL